MRLLNGRWLIAAATIGAVGVVAAIWLLPGLPNAANDPVNKTAPQIIAAARGVVDVEGGIVRISPPRDGAVVSVKVAEGTTVKAGDVLAELDSRQEMLAEQIADAELKQAQQQVRLAQLKEKSAAKQLDRLRKPASGKPASDQSLEDATDAHAAATAELDVASSAANIAQIRLDLAKRERQLQSIRAPVAGVVVRQNARVGEVVSAQGMTEMFALMPATAKIVRAEIPEEYLRLIAVDMPVEIIPDNRAAKPFSGRVMRISPVLTQPKRGDTGEERSDIRTASAIISVDDRVSLTVGQRVVVKASQ